MVYFVTAMRLKMRRAARGRRRRAAGRALRPRPAPGAGPRRAAYVARRGGPLCAVAAAVSRGTKGDPGCMSDEMQGIIFFAPWISIARTICTAINAASCAACSRRNPARTSDHPARAHAGAGKRPGRSPRRSHQRCSVQHVYGSLRAHLTACARNRTMKSRTCVCGKLLLNKPDSL